jgi:hypothetical protein
MVDPKVIFIDGTHIKASANKKKFQKEQVAKVAKIYEEQLRAEVNAEREALGKKPIKDDGEAEPPTVEKTVSTTDPDAGMFVKGEHDRQFAYEAHTVCDKHGFVLDVEVTAGNVHDSVAFDAVYERVTRKFGFVSLYQPLLLGTSDSKMKNIGSKRDQTANIDLLMEFSHYSVSLHITVYRLMNLT